LDPGSLLLAGYLVLSAAAWLRSPHPHAACLSFVLDLACAALYVSVRQPGVGQRVGNQLAPWMATAGLCVALFFALGRLPGDGSFFSIAALADSSTLGNPDFVAEYMACIVPAALVLVAGRKGHLHTATGLALLAGAAAVFIFIPATTGRLAAASGLVTYGIIIALRHVRPRRLAAVGGALAVVFLIAGAWFYGRPADSGRRYLYEVAADAALVRPVAGHGVGGFAGAFLDAQGERLQEDRPARKWWTNARHAHNQPLQVWVERGLFAMLLLLAFWGWHLYLALRQEGGSPMTASAMAAALICALGSVTYDQVPVRVLLFLLAAIAAREMEEETGGGASSSDLATKKSTRAMKATSAVAVVAGIILLVLPTWHAAADFLFVRGDYETAALLEPANGRVVYYLGVEKMRAGETDEAATLLARGLELRPDLNGMITLGNVLTRADRVEEAESTYLQAIAWKPDFAPAFANLAVLYHRSKDPQAAWRYARRALSLRPSDPQYRRIWKEICEGNDHCPD